MSYSNSARLLAPSSNVTETTAEFGSSQLLGVLFDELCSLCRQGISKYDQINVERSLKNKTSRIIRLFVWKNKTPDHTLND